MKPIKDEAFWMTVAAVAELFVIAYLLWKALR